MKLRCIERCEREHGWPAEHPWVELLAEEVGREVAERFMELPVDADGEPVRVGDEVWLPDGERAVVLGVNGACLYHGPGGGCGQAPADVVPARRVRHHRPTVEEVLREFGYAVQGGYLMSADGSRTELVAEGEVARYAGRLREAVMAESECEQVLTDCLDGLPPPFSAHCSRCGAEWGSTPSYCPDCGARVSGTVDEREAARAE